MKRKKKLKELTLKDNFMFGAVMMNERHCRDFLELALGFPIETVKVSKEKSIIYHPEYKGVRLDIYAKDEKKTHYNIEMQMVRKPALGKRVRYYHGQIDMELLLSGTDYTELPDTYVIFICDFDPFGKEKYCYTFKEFCEEDPEVDLESGSRTLFLSTHGKNKDEVPKALVRLLRFIKADLEESMEDFEDDFVKRLQDSIRYIKGSREMEERFMIFEEMLKEERAEGKAEGKAEFVIELLEELGSVPENLQEKILNEKDLLVLKKWHRLAAKADSIEQFAEMLQ